MIFLDSESVGLTGPCVLIQWAEDNGKPKIHEVFRRPAKDTLRLIERFAAHPGGVCGWNLAFDWFHLQRTYCVLSLLDPNALPTTEGWIDVERDALFGPCVKPQTALDLFLHARKGPMQSLMERDPVRIRRVPRALAERLAEHLQAHIELPGIYFSRRTAGYSWQIQEEDPDFPDVVLRFGASAGLKPLSRHLLGVEALDFPVEKQFHPKEKTWHFLDSEPWKRLLPYHVAFWATNKKARRYASDDITLLRDLWKHFGKPEAGDDDSVLACQVGCVRWRGLALDLELIEDLGQEAERLKDRAPRAPKTVLHGLKQRLSPIEELAVPAETGDVDHGPLDREFDPVEAITIEDTTKRTLEAIVRVFPEQHPARLFAQEVIDARTAEKVLDICQKLLTTKRAHFDFKVIGALSGRMSGSSGLNPQGIPGRHDTWKHIRNGFPMADGELDVLDGGDFDGFEVSIAAAAYDDDNLTAALQEGLKFHALFGAELYGATYEEIKADKDRYTRAKNAVFASFYGAQIPKVAATLNLSEEQTTKGYERFMSRFPGVRREQQRVYDLFCSMRQPGGLGTRVEWHEPADYVESLLGYRRYFTLENRICQALFELAENPPKEWLRLRLGQVKRRDRLQSATGACRSALFGSAFGIQARNMRAAGNHRIQSTGAEITKRLQRRIWDQQPSGVEPWVVSPLNIHDEVMAPRAPSLDLRPVVDEVLDHYRTAVPLIAMSWGKGLKNWGEK